MRRSRFGWFVLILGPFSTHANAKQPSCSVSAPNTDPNLISRMLTQKGIEKDQFETTQEYSERAAGLLHSIASIFYRTAIARVVRNVLVGPSGNRYMDASPRPGRSGTPRGRRMLFGLTLGERKQNLPLIHRPRTALA